MKYCSDFKYDLKVGQIKEKELADILTNKKIEVKKDQKAFSTGNIYIEYVSRDKASGISTTQADYWCIYVTEETFIFVKTEDLKYICREYIRRKHWRGSVKGGDENTSIGVLLPIIDLLPNSVKK